MSAQLSTNNNRGGTMTDTRYDSIMQGIARW